MRIIENFITEEFISEVVTMNKELLYENVWKSNLGWQDSIISPSGVVLIRDLNKQQVNLLKAYITEKLLPSVDDKIIELEAQAYVWHNLSFIPWHSDKEEEDQTRYAATLFLNQEWEADWGGLFLYKIDEKIYGEEPAYNKLVFNDNNYAHATSMLAVNAPFRQTVQLFWKIGK